MALFRRNKEQAPVLPSEVQDYYQAEKRGRSGPAWLLGLVTLLITVLLVFGLFLGGRYVYRKLRKNNKPAPVIVQTQNSPEQNTTDTPSGSPTPPPTPTTPGSGSGSTPPSSNGAAGTSTTPGSAGSTTTPTAPGAVPTGPTTPTTTGDLPTTGPEDTLAIFLAISIFAYLVHRYVISSVKR